MAYDIDFIEEGDLQLHIKKFFLHPKKWADPVNQLGFPIKWQSIKFDDLNLAHIPKERGVYAFTIEPDYAGLFSTSYLCYIGKTNRYLQKRFSEYMDEAKGKGKPRKKVYKMFKQYAGFLHFNFATLALKAQVDIAEDKLINTFVPHVNVVVQVAKVKPEYRYLYE